MGIISVYKLFSCSYSVVGAKSMITGQGDRDLAQEVPQDLVPVRIILSGVRSSRLSTIRMFHSQGRLGGRF